MMTVSQLLGIFGYFGILFSTSFFANEGNAVASQTIWESLPSDLTQCTLVIIRDNNNMDSDQSVQELLEIYKGQDKFLIDFISANYTSPIHQISDVHKLRGRCISAFIPLSNLSVSKPEALYKFLLNSGGVVKTDEDFFLFHSPVEKHLLSSFSSGPIASGITHKLGIISSPKDEVPSTSLYYATCFYCAPGGKPSVFPIKIENLNGITEHSPKLHKRSFSTSTPKLFPDLLQNFHGKVFKVSMPMLARWLIEIRETSPGHFGYRRGVMDYGLQHLEYRYNFTGKFFPSTGGGGTGYKHANGTWVGTVGDVLSGRAEIGHTTGQIYNRNNLVGFSYPIVYEWLTFTTGEPRPHYSWKSVYWPFTSLLWLAVFGSVVIAFFTLTFLLWATNQRVSIPMKVTYLLRTILEQDARKLETSPTHTSRMFIAFWLIFALLVTTSYRSKLVSFLAFPVVEEPPKTFEMLAYSTTYEMALQYIHGAAYTLLKTSPNPTFKTIFKRMELEENDSKCFQRAIGTRFSCISWDSVANFVQHKNLSDKYGKVPLIKAQDTTTFIAVGLIFPKRSAFRTKFDSVISRAMDMGLMGKWKELDYEFIRNERKVWEKATNRSQVVYPSTLNDALTMQNLSGTFYVGAVGLLTGVVIFAIELLFRTWRTRCKRDWGDELSSETVAVNSNVYR